MSASDEVEDLLGRISVPEPREVALPEDLTGELRRLAIWWRSRSDGDPREWSVLVTEDLGENASDALLSGAAAADRAVDSGRVLLVPRVRDRDEIAARTVIALLTRREASTVLGQPVGMPDREWMAACAAVRDRMAEVVEHRGEPLVMLAALGATSIAAVAGSLLAASARRTPCLVDGTDELAAALVADRLCYRAKGWWRAGSDSPDPGRAAAVERIDLSPGLPLGLTDDAGKGAQATLALLGELAD
jgi:nicotinate-nucleotide--dimethylbenzimidazole phosphoribosyltransferase